MQERVSVRGGRPGSCSCSWQEAWPAGGRGVAETAPHTCPHSPLSAPIPENMEYQLAFDSWLKKKKKSFLSWILNKLRRIRNTKAKCQWPKQTLSIFAFWTTNLPYPQKTKRLQHSYPKMKATMNKAIYRSGDWLSTKNLCSSFLSVMLLPGGGCPARDCLQPRLHAGVVII